MTDEIVSLEPEIVSQEEIERLIIALGRGRQRRQPGATFTKADAEALVEWATTVRIDHAILTGVLSGRLLVDLKEDGELVFVARHLAPATAPPATEAGDHEPR